MKIQRIRDVKMPTRGTSGSAGIDFYIPNDECEYNIAPGESILIPSGIRCNVPSGFMLMAANRSSMGKLGMLVGASIVDSDYTGEIHINLWNVSDKYVKLYPNDKVVQFILVPVPTITFEEVDELDEIYSERGNGGFGSTNKK